MRPIIDVHCSCSRDARRRRQCHARRLPSARDPPTRYARLLPQGRPRREIVVPRPRLLGQGRSQQYGARGCGEEGGGVPLIYHVRFDDGTEDPHVPEADVSCGAYYDELYRQRSRAGGEWASRSAEEVYNSFLRKEPLRHQPWGEVRGAAGEHDTDHRCDGRQEQGWTAGQLDLLFTASQIATPGVNATNRREATAMDDCYDVYKRPRVEGEQQMMALV